jgi:hypothetical protein
MPTKRDAEYFTHDKIDEVILFADMLDDGVLLRKGRVYGQETITALVDGTVEHRDVLLVEVQETSGDVVQVKVKPDDVVTHEWRIGDIVKERLKDWPLTPPRIVTLEPAEDVA